MQISSAPACIRKTGKYLIYLFCLFSLVASQKSTLLASNTLFLKETSDTFSVLFITFHVLYLVAYLPCFFSRKEFFFFLKICHFWHHISGTFLNYFLKVVYL